MTPRRLQLAAIAALVLLTPLLAGNACGSGQQSPPWARIEFVPAQSTVTAGDSIQVKILMTVKPGFAAQAYHLSVSALPTAGTIHTALPLAPFDDDGKFFVAPKYHLFDGAIENIVDLQHGATPVGGALEIAEFTYSPSVVPMVTTLGFTEAEVSGPDGTVYTVTALPTDITVVP